MMHAGGEIEEGRLSIYMESDLHARSNLNYHNELHSFHSARLSPETGVKQRRQDGRVTQRRPSEKVGAPIPEKRAEDEGKLKTDEEKIRLP